MSDPLIYTGLGAKELVTTTFPVDGGVTQDMIELGAAALGTRPAGWLTPDHVSVTDGVCVASVWVGNAHAINPPSGSYLLWRRVVDTDGQILIAESTDIRFVVVNDLGAPLPATPTYVTGLTSDDGSVVIGGTADVPDLSVSGGGGAVESVNGQTGVVELTAGDVGADTAAARDAAISAEASRAQSVEGGIELDLANEVTRAEAAESTNAAAVVTEATARASAITTEATARVAGDAVNATAITNEAARAISVEAAKADLVTGKVPTSQLPAMALFKITAVASQAAMLALPAGESYLVSRTDNGRRFMLDSATDPTVLGNWILVDTDPSAAVDTVNGQTGTVVLAASDVGADTAAARDTAIGVETARAEAAESANASAITAETTRATTAEGTKATSIALAAEVVRATAGEGAAQSAAIAAAAIDATSKANAAQAASQPLDPDLTAIGGLDSTQSGVVASDGAGWLRKSYAALKTALGLVKADVGLGSVDNTADSAKPVSTAQAAADAAVQAFAIQRANHTGTQSADTITDGTTNKVLTAADKTRLANTSGTNTGDQSIPTALPPNGAASGDLSGTYPSPNVAKINGTALSGLATGLLKNTTGTGVPSIATGSDVPNIAESQVTNLTTDLAAKAPLASPALTGTPTVPTATPGTNNTQAASTAFVTAAVPPFAVTTVATAGASQTLTLGASGDTLFDVTLSAATCTLTFAGATTGKECTLTLVARQDATGGRLITWPAAVTWVGGVTPTLSTAAGAADWFTFLTVNGGTTWYGFAGAGNGAGWKARSGGWFTQWGAHAASGMTQNTLVAGPLDLGAVTITQLAMQVTALAAASSIRVGLYADSNGVPGSLLVEATSVTQIDSTSTGVKTTATFSQVVTGRVWVAAVAQGGQPTVQVVNGQYTPGVGYDTAANALGFTPGGYTHNGSVTGALPASFIVNNATTVSYLAAAKVA